MSIATSWCIQYQCSAGGPSVHSESFLWIDWAEEGQGSPGILRENRRNI